MNLTKNMKTNIRLQQQKQNKHHDIKQKELYQSIKASFKDVFLSKRRIEKRKISLDKKIRSYEENIEKLSMINYKQKSTLLASKLYVFVVAQFNS